MSDAESRRSSAPSRRSHPERSTPEGLLPPAAELERYERLVPGITERLIGRWEQQIEHQQALERLRLQSEIDSERLGLIYGFRIAMTFLVVSAIIILAGIITHQPVGTITGGVLGGVDLIALVYVFIAGRNAPPPRPSRSHISTAPDRDQNQSASHPTTS